MTQPLPDPTLRLATESAPAPSFFQRCLPRAAPVGVALGAALALASPRGATAQDSPPAAETFAAACAEASQKARDNGWTAVQGDAPAWLFLARELEHLGRGAFWEHAGGAELPDPVPVIIQYHQELKEKGIELLLVPVPPKAAIMPGEFLAGAARSDGGVFASAPFYGKLTAAGVQVLDLEPLFEKEVAAGSKVYCEQDTHWSPLACRLVATAIQSRFKDAPWAQDAAKTAGAGIVPGEPQVIAIKGDLVGERFEEMKAERLEATKAGRLVGDEILPVPAADDSPVILLGDSHTLVFSEGGDMHCTGAGLPDHLQHQFGFPLSLIAVKASGADSARVRLVRDFARRKPGYLAGKKLLIWCFSAREFTLGKWRPIPAG